MEPTLEENRKNMEKCLRFPGCSIPKCPLDYWMSERMELPDDEKCILISPRTKNVKGIKRGSLMKSVGKYIWDFNRNGSISYPKGVWSGNKGSLGQSSDKTGTPEVG